jgi:hypothetical protein
MMETSLAQLHDKVENLTTAVHATIEKETFQRRIVDSERDEILKELNGLKQIIRKSGRGTVAQQAEELGVAIVEPNRLRGQYAGQVLGLDYRAMLLKYSNTSAMELPFSAFAVEQEHPGFGDSVRIGFKDGVMSVVVTARSSKYLAK